MLKYRIRNVEKMGKNNIYNLENLQNGSSLKLTLLELKPLLENNEVVNANWKSKVVETPDAYMGIQSLRKIMSIDGKLWVLERRDKANPNWVSYCFYNNQGVDITKAIYMCCKGEYRYKQNGFLSVREVDKDMVSVLIKKINGYCKDFGMLPIIIDVEMLKRMPKNRVNSFRI